MENKVNGFKVFCVANGIKQKVLCEKADVGITSMHHLQNNGKASTKTVTKIVESLNRDFKINITVKELEEIIQK
jgi:hypothetical protein